MQREDGYELIRNTPAMCAAWKHNYLIIIIIIIIITATTVIVIVIIIILLSIYLLGSQTVCGIRLN